MAGNNEDSLLLYSLPGSFFGQIALLGIHEKQLKYEVRFVRLDTLENRQPWFLKLNPNGQVPVLKHGNEIIPGSDKILLYLDDKFSSGSSKLFPLEGTEGFCKVEKYDKLIRSIKTSVLTMGVMTLPHLSCGLNIPEYEIQFRQRIIQRIKELASETGDSISDIERENNKAKAAFVNILGDPAVVEKEIRLTEKTLDQFECELSSHAQEFPGSQKQWLICDQFTAADVILAILLQRLDILGLSPKMLDVTKRPHLLAYKERLYQRPTFQAYLADLQKMHQQFENIIKC